jgi:hypothetical protein
MTILTPDKMKDITALSSAVDVNLLQPFIEIAEEFHLKEVLTEDFYDEIVESIESNTLSGDTKVLVDKYVIPCIGYYAWYESSPHLYVKSEAKGLVNKFSDNSTAIDSVAFKAYKQSIYDKALMYRNRLQKYLNDYQGLFPTYQRNCGINNTKSNSTGFFMKF